MERDARRGGGGIELEGATNTAIKRTTNERKRNGEGGGERQLFPLSPPPSFRAGKFLNLSSSLGMGVGRLVLSKHVRAGKHVRPTLTRSYHARKTKVVRCNWQHSSAHNALRKLTNNIMFFRHIERSSTSSCCGIWEPFVNLDCSGAALMVFLFRETAFFARRERRLGSSWEGRERGIFNSFPFLSSFFGFLLFIPVFSGKDKNGAIPLLA